MHEQEQETNILASVKTSSSTLLKKNETKDISTDNYLSSIKENSFDNLCLSSIIKNE